MSIYPKVLDDFSRAHHLKKLVEARNAIVRYKTVKQAKDKYEECVKNLKGTKVVTQEDVNKLEEAERGIRKHTDRLNGLNIEASIEKLGASEIEVKSVLTDRVIDTEDGKLEIEEAVEISIPGVARITLAPGGVDVNETTSELRKAEEQREEICERTGAENLRKLIELKNLYEDNNRKTESAKENYEKELGTDDFIALEKDYQERKDLEGELENLDDEISELCEEISLEAFIETQDQRIKEIESRYKENDPLGGMEQKLEELTNDLDKLSRQQSDASNIPERFRNIEDPDEFKKTLKADIDFINDEIDKETKGLNDEKKNLGDETAEELKKKRDDAEERFNQKKQECKRWMHILEVLRNVKDSIESDNAMDDVQKRFAEYLVEISNGRIKLDSMDENMDMEISSASVPVTYDLLSEGTKGTIALAFRLAMLDHLFPGGGGLAVFDDPFTEMDEERTKISCELVQKFAEKGNQVIFTTCDSKYKNLMRGNVIEV